MAGPKYGEFIHQAAHMPSITPNMPQWRQTLLAVPEDQRCDSQRSLIRAMELVDYLTATFENEDRIPSFPESDEMFRILLAFLEITYLPIKDRPVIALMPPDTPANLANYMVKPDFYN